MQDNHDRLTLKFGKWFEASAKGRYAITVLALLATAFLATYAAGLF